MKRFALDFGNSRVKCYAQGPQLLGAFAYSASDWEDALLSVIRQFADDEDCLLGISSVNPAMDMQFDGTLDNEKQIHHIRTKPLIINSGIIDFSEVSGMGEDRMHGLLGAMSHFSPPLITIDCGTAITFNILNAERKCLGGSIMPGFTTMYKSLGAVTAGLPNLAPSPTHSKFGNNTNDAIHVGISTAISGAITTYLQEFQEFSFCIFGGDAEAILGIMDKRSKIRLLYAPDCIAEGIFKALDIMA
jgi:type III pantothenate kinase